MNVVSLYLMVCPGEDFLGLGPVVAAAPRWRMCCSLQLVFISRDIGEDHQYACGHVTQSFCFIDMSGFCFISLILSFGSIVSKKKRVRLLFKLSGVGHMVNVSFGYILVSSEILLSCVYGLEVSSNRSLATQKFFPAAHA